MGVSAHPLTDVATQFPVLAATGIAYLDSAATSQTPEPVLAAMDEYYRTKRATVHRSVYPLAAEATELFEGARERTAGWLGSTPAETILTRNATEAINLVAYSWGRTNVGAGDRVLVTEMEHHSNLVPWQILCQETGATLEYVPIAEDGTLDLDELEVALAREPKLLAVTHVSNVLGTINPVAEIVRRAHAAGSVVLVDGSQAVPQIPVDLRELDADFYAWTGHKAYGPTGVGVLHGRREILEAMPPFLGGGHMIASVKWEGTTWAGLPGKFEAGTSAVAEVIGLGAAVAWLQELGMESLRDHEADIVGYALERLAAVPGLTIFGPEGTEQRGAVVAFALEGVHPHDVAELLGRGGVCVRAGHHCTQPLMRRLGVGATSRASFAAHSTRADVDRLLNGLATVRSVFELP